MITVLQRAFSSNLKKVSAKPGEKAILESRGIHDSSLQTYFVWRRSLMVFILISTFLSFALTGYREYSEDEDQLDAFDVIATKAIEQLTSAAKTALPIALPAVQSQVDAATEKLKDAAEGHSSEPKEAEDTEETEGQPAEKHPASESAKTKKSFLSSLDENMHLISLGMMLLAAVAVIFNWTRFGFTFKLLAATFVFSFIMPILLSFCPWSWWEPESVVSPSEMTPFDKMERMADGLVEGLKYLGMLLPAVLSLLPGVQKACIRVKSLLPQATLPGWYLAAAAPFYGLFLLVISVAVNQIFSDPMLLAGLLLFIGSVLIFGIRMDVFTRPLVSEKDYRQMFAVQKVAGLMTMSAGVLLLVFVQSHEVFGVRLLGLDAKTSVLQPIDLVELFLETIGRAMFMTVLGADFFMRMNLSAWKSSLSFRGTEEEAQYDATMSALDETIKGPQ